VKLGYSKDKVKPVVVDIKPTKEPKKAKPPKKKKK